MAMAWRVVHSLPSHLMCGLERDAAVLGIPPTGRAEVLTIASQPIPTRKMFIVSGLVGRSVPNYELFAGRSYARERGDRPQPGPTGLWRARGRGSLLVTQDRCDPPS